MATAKKTSVKKTAPRKATAKKAPTKGKKAVKKSPKGATKRAVTAKPKKAPRKRMVGKVTRIPLLTSFEQHAEQVKPKAERDGIKVGLKTGLVLTHFINELFFANYAKQYNDESLYAAMQAEFPNREVIQSPAAYRSYFNSGKHGHGWGEALNEEEKLPRYKTEMIEAE